jgi:hypothetical protein
VLYCKNTKESTMLKLIGLITVVYFLFHWGIVQLIALWIMVALSTIASV